MSQDLLGSAKEHIAGAAAELLNAEVSDDALTTASKRLTQAALQLLSYRHSRKKHSAKPASANDAWLQHARRSTQILRWALQGGVISLLAGNGGGSAQRFDSDAFWVVRMLQLRAEYRALHSDGPNTLMSLRYHGSRTNQEGVDLLNKELDLLEEELTRFEAGDWYPDIMAAVWSIDLRRLTRENLAIRRLRPNPGYRGLLFPEEFLTDPEKWPTAQLPAAQEVLACP